MTSFPDLIETDFEMEEYKKWVIETVATMLIKLQEGQFAIFYQSDIRILARDGTCLEWLVWLS